jgi:hypothetical protein
MAQGSVPWWALALTELNYLGLLPASELTILLSVLMITETVTNTK